MGNLAVNEMTTYRWSFEEDTYEYAKAGIPAIGVWRQKLSDYGEEKGVELLRETGLRVSSLLWAGGFTGSDGRSYKDSVLDGREAIRTAARLETSTLIVYSGARAGHTHNHARRLFKSALSELLPFASEFGVALAIEPMHAGCAAEWTFLTSLQNTLDLLNELDDSQLRLVFDTYHMGHSPEVLAVLPELARRIAVVQLGDAKGPPNGEQNRCKLGEGTIPLCDIVSTLNQHGFTGYYEIELMGEEIESTDYQELLAHSKQAFDAITQVVERH